MLESLSPCEGIAKGCIWYLNAFILKTFRKLMTLKGCVSVKSG